MGLQVPTSENDGEVEVTKDLNDTAYQIRAALTAAGVKHSLSSGRVDPFWYVDISKSPRRYPGE